MWRSSKRRRWRCGKTAAFHTLEVAHCWRESSTTSTTSSGGGSSSTAMATGHNSRSNRREAAVPRRSCLHLTDPSTLQLELHVYTCAWHICPCASHDTQT
ncbi:hypothetical protein TraAM80_02956 [Trypanosoma rangeli]|uniref:Uncharacterized protein n=1 Tax=Trypanosoma rangeli TaxID=5698 RepID=A0A422NRC6_TRYRA|nr:uncharacterized protein TraAM80_02956 [Trypanosoma rangeli]RNF08023.1 hypothetical protein TraAM80_02956 [Trypanosoma rangeli]|eukprot:RNF08023.1 hypothetical protein TraAM80_02956 [Trypanosoma rangeli]